MVFCNRNIKYRYFNGKNSHNPYFNRWFSAIKKKKVVKALRHGHNPYFNRWFSAINQYYLSKKYLDVTILILIDGFLQY